MNALDLTLLRPLWLLALIALAAYGGWLFRYRGGLGDWARIANPELLQALTVLGRIDPGASRLSSGAALAAAAIAMLALSGPAFERRDTVSFRNLDGVLFVVDASASVTEDARWTQMSTMGRFGIAALGTRPGGLIVYGGDAYVASDMTADKTQLGQTFSLIDPKTVPDPGSRPERGLELAVRLLQDAGVIAGDVVLFTDGAGLDVQSLQQTGRIAEQGARLSLVSLTDPTPQMLAHAGVGDGQVFTLAQTDALAAWLGDAARTRLQQQDYPLLFWKDCGRYLLALALFPLLLLFRRSPA